MQKLLAWIGGVLVTGSILAYEYYRHLGIIPMLETVVLGIAAVLSILHLLSYWHRR